MGMGNRRLIQLMVTLAIILGCVVVTFSSGPQSPEQPIVVKAFVPVYPVIALHAEATGTVIVEVKIDIHGEVTSARAISGHKLLHLVSEMTAKRWVFAEDSSANIER